MALKVMVVDDTIFYRKIIKDVLETLPDVEVVGTVNSGALALNRIPTLKPDILTLDVEMPGMNGLEVLEEIKRKGYNVICIMISSKTIEGSAVTVQALESGAFDFIAKPDDTSAEANISYLKAELGKMLTTISRQQQFRGAIKAKQASDVRGIPSPLPQPVIPSPPP